MGMEEINEALERVNQRRWWIWGVFLLCSSPGLLNAWHIMVTLFLSHIPTHWCRVPELVERQWTNDQIRNISSPSGLSESSCSVLGWNYTELAALGYQEALLFVSSQTTPAVSPCTHFMYEEEVPYSSTVSEWDLVCDRLPMKSNIQASIAIGKFIGGLVFGFVADKYGRKTSFIFTCLTYIVAGPLAAFAPSYLLFIIARFFIGVAGAGCYEAAYTILTEVASKERRAFLGCVFNMSYPIGYMTLSVMALMFTSWRTLQLAISLPMTVLLIHCWLIPESPKWLMTKGRRIEAWAVIEKIDKSLVPSTSKDSTNVQKKQEQCDPWLKRVMDGLSQLFILFTTPELLRRICICYFSWFVGALTYYVLALNADSFSSNRHIYIALSGLVELPSYLLPVIVLMWLGRKTTSALLFLISGLSFITISILIMYHKSRTLILVVALLGRFSISAVFAVIIMHTSELFPTANRNSAIGTSLAVCQLGSIAAPYVVDVMGKYSQSSPSTLCGGLALISALLTLLLPETRGKPLMDTVQDLKHSRQTQIRNCCSFS